jgi:predicted metal-dependent hydrolase
VGELGAACRESPPPELIQGIDEFNRRELFECHETLEALWMRERRPVRELYQGIIQVGVGFYHVGRGNYVGAVRTAQRGLDRLRTLPGTCQQVNVAQLVAETEIALQRLVELGPQRLDQFDPTLIPTIGLAP